jgi:hypothetical protein
MRKTPVFQDFIQQLRDNPNARDLARQAADRYIASHGTYLKGRVTAGAFTSVFFPVGTGLGVTTIALYGDARFAIERGADFYGVLEATIGGDPLRN